MPTDRPNILFLLSDQHAFRHFSHRDPHGDGEPVHTPTFDRLAQSGTRLEQTYCPVPLCGPSRACVLTGKEAHKSNAWDNRNNVIPPHLDTLPGTLSDAGYETCLQGKMHLGGTRQFVGFDHRPYGDLTGEGGHQWEPPNPWNLETTDWSAFISESGITNIPESLLQEQNVVQETVSFLREHRHACTDRPWFLCASFSRPHWPRTAPRRHFERYWPDGVTQSKIGREGDAVDHPLTQRVREHYGVENATPEEELRARAGYFACVDYLDEIIGDLLNTLERDGFLKNTIIVYASDHGEAAGEHGVWDKRTWFEASLRVPLFIQLPEHRSGDLDPSTISTPVNLLDLFPTLCGLTGVEPPEELDGYDLSDAVRTGTEPERGPVFTDSLVSYPGEDLEYRMVRDGEYKYVQFADAPELLFDLGSDPQEQQNLAPDATGADAEALSRLRVLVEETIDFEEARRRREDSTLLKTYRNGGPKGTGNAYHFPDGRVIDADTPLYHPHVIAEDPEAVFDDYPSTTDSDAD